MPTGKLVFVAALVYSALFFLLLAVTVHTAAVVPFWQPIAMVGLAAYLGYLAFDIVRGSWS